MKYYIFRFLQQDDMNVAIIYRVVMKISKQETYVDKNKKQSEKAIYRSEQLCHVCITTYEVCWRLNWLTLTNAVITRVIKQQDDKNNKILVQEGKPLKSGALVPIIALGAATYHCSFNLLAS